MLGNRKRLFPLTLLAVLTIGLSGSWWLLGDRSAPDASGSAPAGMEHPGFIPPAKPGPVEPVVVDLARVAPGQLDPNNKYDRWRKGKVDFSKRDRIVNAERFKALKDESPLLVPSLDVQVAEDAIGPAAPAAAGAFDSLDYTECCGGGGNVPPDPELAAGPNHLIAVVNVAFEIYDKAGASLRAPTTIESFMSANPACTNVFDPNAVYDEAADRFVMGVATRGGYYCAAVSQTADPTGSWYVYAFPMSSGNEFFDYPHAGVGRDALYVGANIFNTVTFKEGRIYALDKTAMYAGNPAAYVSAGLGSAYDTPQPLNLHGWNQGTWPESGPHYFFSDKNYNGRTYAIHAWTDPFGANTVAEAGVVDLNAATGVTAGMPLDVPQSGGGTVDGGDWRPQDFEYRNGYGWTVMTIACNPGGGTVNCVRWAQIDLATRTVADAGVYASNGTYRSYADLAVNDCSDMAVGYSKSSAAMYPAIWYTGRLAADTGGTLQPETELKAGELPYTSFEPNAPRRWGDYTGMTIDPDGETFWYLGEYSKDTGTSNGRWGTYIGSFGFAGCDGTAPLLPAAPTNLTATDGGNGTVNLAWTDNAGDEDAYYVVRDGSRIATLAINSQSYTDSGVAGGGHDYKVQAHNAAGTSDSNTAHVEVVNNATATQHVADLDGSVTSIGKDWRAQVTVTVRDSGGLPVSGATVSGNWSGDASGPASCFTDGSGTCGVASNDIPKKQTNSVVFTVTGVTGGGLTYDPAANADPDGDSSGTAIQVSKNGTTQDPGAVPNAPPNAGFGFTVTGLSVQFADQSSDSDGTVDSWAWNFGDGTVSTEQNPSHTYAAAGSYSVSLTVTDNVGATATDTQTVPVGVTVETMHVGDLDDSSAAGNGGRWTASVTVTVHDADEGPVSGATVSGSWSNGANGSASCTTGSSGQCALVKQNVKSNVASVTLGITAVAHSTLVYGGANHDPDGDSDGSVITISRP